MIKKYFYEETGMYIDWDQLKKLPEIDTLVDIGVGDNGTENLYNRFSNQKLILVDPIDEAEKYISNNLEHRDVIYFKTGVGSSKGELIMNLEKNRGRSSFLQITDINDLGSNINKKIMPIDKLDNLIEPLNDLGKIGLKIDTEGYELEVVLGAKQTLKRCKFLMAEVRHNHESFEGCYKLYEFMEEMRSNGFQLTMIFTAKPFIADLCFQPLKDL